MKSIYGMSERELRENLIDALVRWHEAERTIEYYEQEIKKNRDELVAEVARRAAEAAETANG